jgi:hypothetical protein
MEKEGHAHPELDEAHRNLVETILRTKPVVLLGITASQIHQNKAPRWTTPVTLLAEEATLKQLTEGKKTEEHKGSEILPAHVDILDDEGTVVIRIHETAACHSYHQMANGIRVASIPTMLQFFFAYMYSGVDEDEITHLLCVSQRLVDLASHKEKRRYALLTPIDCIGTQQSLTDIKRRKAQLYTELSTSKTSVDFLKYFFTYNPAGTETQRSSARAALKKTRKARRESSY